MAEHFCKIHNTAYFMKGKMKGFAHPLADGTGWCNEPEADSEDGMGMDEAENAEAKTHAPAAKPAWKPKFQPKPDNTASIETQVAFKGAVEMMSTGIIKADHALFQAAIIWAMSKLPHPIAQVAEIAKAIAETPKPIQPPQGDKPQPITADAVVENLKSILIDKTWNNTMAMKEAVALGGKGTTITAAIKSLTEGNLLVYNAKVNQEKARALAQKVADKGIAESGELKF